MKITDWFSCYDDNWNGSIHPLAYAHPAKFARGLIKRIYTYLLSLNLIYPGDTVVDCFGGVGLGALDAITNGLNYIGCELEQKFVDLGQGCDCTGIGKADWVRFYGRWDRANYKDGRHWCPDCLEAVKRIDETPGQQLGLFGPVDPVASYKRNSGRIPHTRPHHFSGNIELFLRRPEAKGKATLLQGDSRKLAEVIQQAGGLVSSPPFRYTQGGCNSPNLERDMKGVMNRHGGTKDDGYGTTPGQLASLPEGSLKILEIDCSTWSTADEGRPLVVSSPPFAGNSGGRGEASRNGIDPALFDRHQGAMVGGIGSAGNLAGMKPGDVNGVISSPPYEGTPIAGFNSGVKQSGGLGRQYKLGNNPGGSQQVGDIGYGTTPGQLGQAESETFWSAAAVIIDQCYQLLPPGAPAVWVLKSFVRDGAIVDFPGQWQALCEACGFETVEIIRAWLVKDKGIQVGLNGEQVKKTVKRSSFFRRIYERKYPHLSIDYEVVLITKKVLQ